MQEHTDILSEGAIGLAEASRSLPPIDGRRPNPSTLWRWCRLGVRGVRLDYGRLGKRIVTSRPALARFAAALAAADRTVPPPPPPRMSSPRPDGARCRAIEDAERVCAANGI